MGIKRLIPVYLGLLVAMFCWGFTFIWYKEAYPQITPISLVTLRLIIAVFLIFLTVIFFKKLNTLKKKDIPLFLILAFFEPLVYFLGESYGMQYVSATLASLLIATIPLFMPFAAHYFFKEKLKPGNYLGIILSVIGVVIIIHTDKDNYESTPLGVLLIMVAVISTIGFSVYVKKLSPKYNTLSIVLYQNIFGLLFFIPLFIIFDKCSILRSGIDFKDIIPVIKLAVFGSVIAFVLYIHSIRYIGIARANVFTNLIPVVTAILSFYLLNEQFGLRKITGIAVVIAGLILSQMKTLVKYIKKNNHENNAPTDYQN